MHRKRTRRHSRLAPHAACTARRAHACVRFCGTGPKLVDIGRSRPNVAGQVYTAAACREAACSPSRPLAERPRRMGRRLLPCRGGGGTRWVGGRISSITRSMNSSVHRGIAEEVLRRLRTLGVLYADASPHGWIAFAFHAMCRAHGSETRPNLILEL